jgi:cell division protein FtsA
MALAQTDRSGVTTLTHLFSNPSAGIRKGVVENPTQLAQALSVPLGIIKTLSRSSLKHITMSVGSPDLKVQTSKGVVAVSRADDEIQIDDIERALQSARAVTLPANRIVVDSMIKEFVVDGIAGIGDPIGMLGKRLEVNLMLIESFAPAIKPLQRAVETLGGFAEKLVVSPLAAANAVLTQDQKENGVLLIDIGFSKTSVAIFEEGKISHVAILPVGGGTVTNDLAIGLRVPIDVAETIKLSYGNALAKEVSSRDAIELAKVDPRVKGTVTRKFIAEIIEDRLAEIFELVNTEVKRVGKLSQIPAGIVLTGGGAKMPSIAELARQELRLSAQVGIPSLSGISSASTDITLQAEDPSYATVLGLLEYANTEGEESRMKINSHIGSGLKKILNYFIP